MRSAVLCADFLDFIGVLSVEEMNFLAEVSFDVTTDAHGLFRVDEVDCDSVLAKATGSTDAMQVGLAVGGALLVDGQIKVDDDVDLLDVNLKVEMDEIKNNDSIDQV